ncbi:Hypothetical protein NTJ_07460 [Nesidiocoris tenuis]|uniref:Uncharacterized protein n=1 Tax=Nesidiocoris tenuis TaxID=355587 RepID=A0ABN7AUT8_9HEMI|nr:Hypothetical protein NTJ_07460 [Nesidiocoris tenuis]
MERLRGMRQRVRMRDGRDSLEGFRVSEPLFPFQARILRVDPRHSQPPPPGIQASATSIASPTPSASTSNPRSGQHSFLFICSRAWPRGWGCFDFEIPNPEPADARAFRRGGGLGPFGSVRPQRSNFFFLLFVISSSFSNRGFFRLARAQK